MAKKYNINIISKRKTYIVKEIAVLLGVHTRTVQIWLSQGLKAVEKSFPFLIHGEELAQFLANKQSKQKHPLAPDEFLCFKCRKATKSLPGTINKTITEKRMGGGKILIIIKALCEICGSKVNRFDAIYTKDVAELLGTEVSLVNINIEQPIV